MVKFEPAAGREGARAWETGAEVAGVGIGVEVEVGEGLLAMPVFRLTGWEWAAQGKIPSNKKKAARAARRFMKNLSKIRFY
jgi:hypothetical protein